jgi:FlaA1/EpsC-like NDP-sugar epimerase
MRIISHTGHSLTNDTDIFDVSRKVEEWTKSAQSIPEFYANQEIFVTGATGFLGKVLVEKLLRSCGDLQKIYILLRPKKGKSIDERLKELIGNLIFLINIKIKFNFF